MDPCYTSMLLWEGFGILYSVSFCFSLLCSLLRLLPCLAMMDCSPSTSVRQYKPFLFNLLLSYHSNRKEMKTEICIKRWAISVVSNLPSKVMLFRPLFCESNVEDFGTLSWKRAEFCKQSLSWGCPSRNLEDRSAKRNTESAGKAHEKQGLIRNGARGTCVILIMELHPLCPCPENLQEAALRSNRRILLVEEILRQCTIQFAQFVVNDYTYTCLQ